MKLDFWALQLFILAIGFIIGYFTKQEKMMYPEKDELDCFDIVISIMTIIIIIIIVFGVI